MAIDPPVSHTDRHQLVILVRHAEKQTPNAPNPGLSAAGQERALALAEALADAGVQRIITTEFQRTQLTAMPIANQAGLEPQAIRITTANSIEAHVADVVSTISRDPHASVVLVIGHSNTVPLIIAALNGPRLPFLSESAYNNLFVVDIKAKEAARLIRSHYGAPNPI